MTENFCRLLLYKILEGIQTPERPRTLTEFLMESPPVRRSFSRFCVNLTFLRFHFSPPFQSESSKENESDPTDLADQSLLFESTNEQI